MCGKPAGKAAAKNIEEPGRISLCKCHVFVLAAVPTITVMGPEVSLCKDLVAMLAERPKRGWVWKAADDNPFSRDKNARGGLTLTLYIYVT